MIEAVPDATPDAVRETARVGSLPLYDLTAWQAHGLTAGITGRGPEPGGGFDLGLWSAAPVGEVMTRWRAFRRSFPEFEAVILGGQVHGTEVRRVDAASGWVQIDGVDGWVTTTPGILLTVTVADCIPIYLAVPGRGIGLLHAGWRGTAGGILGRGIAALLAGTGGTASDVIMHAGVGICGPCYEVGSEVVTGCGLTARGEGPWQVDLRAVLVRQAADAGVGRVTASAWCSGHDGPLFYSHRRSGGTDGRMAAYLGMAPS
jgi:YfiH family protein